MSTPEKWMSLSSPIMISSISLQCPSLTLSGLSKVDAISPPAGGWRWTCQAATCIWRTQPAAFMLPAGQWEHSMQMRAA